MFQNNTHGIRIKYVKGSLNGAVIKHKSHLSLGYMSKYHSLYLTHVCTDLKRLRPEIPNCRYKLHLHICKTGKKK